MKEYIAFSGGVESRTMAVLFGNKADALFSDTGSEHDELYEELESVEKAVREFHNNDFKIIRVRNQDWDSLEDYIKHAKYFPSFGQRFCTRMFKIETIDNYLKKFENEGARLMIGLNADEQDLRTGNHGLLQFVDYSYPLADAGIGRSMCIDILNSLGIAPDFPAYMQRGGCWFCYYKSKKEYAAMALKRPDMFDRLIDLQDSIQDKRGKPYHIIPSIPNLRDFKKMVQSSLFNYDDMYPVINTTTSCGVFCNR